MTGLWFDASASSARFQPNKRYTFLDTLAMGGVAGTLDSLYSQTATQRDTLMLADTTTFDYLYMRDNVWLQDKARFGTGCKSGGGNY